MNPVRLQHQARSLRFARRQSALSRAVALAGVLLLVGGCSVFFDDSGLRDDNDNGTSGSGGQSIGGSGSSGGMSGDDSGGASGVGGGLPGVLYEALIQSDDPIAYYRFDRLEGTRTPSLIQGTPAAILVGSAEIVPPGAVGSPGDGALTRDGKSLANINGSIGLDLDDTFTIELWFSFAPASDSQNSCLISMHDYAGNAGFVLGASLDLSRSLFGVNAILSDETGDGGEVSLDLSSAPLTFTYLAGSSDGDTLTLCVGGVGPSFVCRSTGLGGTLRPINVQQIGLGNDINNFTASLRGQIDELAIYDEALDEGTLRGHFMAGSGLPFDPSDLPF